MEGLDDIGLTLRHADLVAEFEAGRSSYKPVSYTHLDVYKRQDPVSLTQVQTLRRNCAEFGVPIFPMGDPEQGIVHVVGPQLGLTQPGMTIVCGDSHTSTHGAFGALALSLIHI